MEACVRVSAARAVGFCIDTDMLSSLLFVLVRLVGVECRGEMAGATDGEGCG